MSTSKFVGRYKTSQSNLQVVAASRNSGFGYNRLSNFFAGLDVPPIMHLKTYQRLAKQVHCQTLSVTEENLQAAAATVRQLYMSCDEGLAADSTIDITVSFDGTWHKRGHSSHFGVGVVIDYMTGLVLDIEVLSNYCQNCSTGPDVSDDLYSAWKEKHAPSCQKNYSGSANSMEVGAAKVLFGRSIQKHNFRYTNVICDGDAKTITTLNKEAIYDVEVSKEDCVNHIAKRLWKGLNTMKKKLSGTRQSISGKGKVTNLKMRKMSNYYANQLKRNAPDPVAMRNGVMASLLHMMSTDEKPRHELCPMAEDSWCHYNRALAKQETPRPHKPELSVEIGERLMPLYERLCDPDLLARCSRMATQNANESFNAQVWRRAPKTEPSSLQTVQTAAGMATLEWNCGAIGFLRVLQGLGIQSGHHTTLNVQKQVLDRIKQNEVRSSSGSKLSRKRRKLDKTAKQDSAERREGLTYGPGAFNS